MNVIPYKNVSVFTFTFYFLQITNVDTHKKSAFINYEVFQIMVKGTKFKNGKRNGTKFYWNIN